MSITKSQYSLAQNAYRSALQMRRGKLQKNLSVSPLYWSGGVNICPSGYNGVKYVSEYHWWGVTDYLSHCAVMYFEDLTYLYAIGDVSLGIIVGYIGAPELGVIFGIVGTYYGAIGYYLGQADTACGTNGAYLSLNIWGYWVNQIC